MFGENGQPMQPAQPQQPVQPQYQPAPQQQVQQPVDNTGFVPTGEQVYQNNEQPQYAQTPQPTDYQQFQQQQVELGDAHFTGQQEQQPSGNEQPLQQQQTTDVFQPAQLPQQRTPFIHEASNLEAANQAFDNYLDEHYPLPEMPKWEDVPGDDPNALGQFFADQANVNREIMKVEAQREQVKAVRDEYMWEEVYTKYPALRNAPRVQNTLRQLFAGSRSEGLNQTPLQVTDAYVGELNSNWRSGYQANQTQTVIRQSQPMPNGGQNQAPSASTITGEDMASLNKNAGNVIDDAANIVAKMRANKQGGFN